MIIKALAAGALCVVFASTAIAQDNNAAGMDLPEICKSAAPQGMGGMEMGNMGNMGPMDQAHQDMMMGMDKMHTDMMTGMMASDIDVAFACGMIPHHQGAIDMAKAQLEHGDDQTMKDTAQKVIDDQTREIEELKDWLANQGK